MDKAPRLINQTLKIKTVHVMADKRQVTEIVKS